MRSKAPQIFGILNITEDSFSDGLLYFTPQKAQKQGQHLMQAGAGVLDIGFASSHPNAQAVSAAEELRRLQWVLPFFADPAVAVSVDSFLPQTQLAAMEQGADYLNDITGFAQPDFYPHLAAHDTKLIVMHSIQRSSIADQRTSDPQTIVEQIITFFEERLEALCTAGIARERLIIDPGMGFFLGSNAEASLRVLAELRTIRDYFALPLLVSVSRKSFLRKIAGTWDREKGHQEIDPIITAAETYALFNGADMIRTHRPELTQQAVQLYQNLSPWANRVHTEPNRA